MAVHAQLTSNSGKYYTNFQGIDYVFIFDGITPSSEISYIGTGTNINWYKSSNLSNSISNTAYISPEDATGYTLNVDGKLTHIWVIDYKNFLSPLPNYSIEPENNPSAQCKDIKLLINVPLLSYTTSNGLNKSISRNFSINYQTLKWSGLAWQPVDTTITVVLPANQISVPVPYCNTSFTLSGDQFATDLGVSPISVSSSQYSTNAVICHLTTAVTSRSHDLNNEDQAPSKTTPIDFSAPIEVSFQSNANEPVVKFYNWGIYKNNALIINRTDKDLRYTFTEAGTYNVKATASNNICSYSDSITVTVSESAIYAPNVFTPNGDGLNDEFRVAYKSIISFHCWVYNRWGREVYSWTDPTKGWDGKINGKDAVPGPYFYVIKALGSDFDPKSTPDSKTHKRVGEYLLKGDINLLRGVQ